MRLIAARMRARGQEAYPIVEIGGSSDFAAAAPKHAVIEVVLSGVPFLGAMLARPTPIQALRLPSLQWASRAAQLGRFRQERNSCDRAPPT